MKKSESPASPAEDEVLRRMLSTPPQPKKAKPTKAVQPKVKKGSKA